MPDLNEWQLVAGPDVITFGTLASDYPFSTQVAMSEVDRDVQDAPHPTSDGMIMGRDRLRGFTLSFAAKILGDEVDPNKWNQPLDLYRAFARRWRADTTRLTPGAYATLRNVDRGVLVYGRPRGIAPVHKMVRQGVLDFQMDFDSISPDWYDATEKSAIIVPGASSGGGFTGPLKSPIKTTVVNTEVGDTVNDGDLAAWPVISMAGPFSSGSFELIQGTKVLVKITIAESVY